MVDQALLKKFSDEISKINHSCSSFGVDAKSQNPRGQEQNSHELSHPLPANNSIIQQVHTNKNISKNLRGQEQNSHELCYPQPANSSILKQVQINNENILIKNKYDELSAKEIASQALESKKINKIKLGLMEQFIEDKVLDTFDKNSNEFKKTYWSEFDDLKILLDKVNIPNRKKKIIDYVDKKKIEEIYVDEAIEEVDNPEYLELMDRRDALLQDKLKWEKMVEDKKKEKKGLFNLLGNTNKNADAPKQLERIKKELAVTTSMFGIIEKKIKVKRGGRKEKVEKIVKVPVEKLIDNEKYLEAIKKLKDCIDTYFGSKKWDLNTWMKKKKYVDKVIEANESTKIDN
jgi:hypothetical protein